MARREHLTICRPAGSRKLRFATAGLEQPRGFNHVGQMLEVTILASGSSGNAALVRCGTTQVLVDAGLSARQLSLRLESAGVSPAALDGIVLTHEHGDHTSALRVLAARCEIPVFANRMTAAALEADGRCSLPRWQFFSNGAVFAIGSLTLEPFQVPHDAADPVGFVIRNGNASFGVLTDLGYATAGVIDRLRDVQALLIETNYDEQLLERDTKRPWSVKQRIQSRHGHLSNVAAAAIAGEFVDGPLHRVIVGHLSRDCNSPEIATGCMRGHLAQRGRPDIEITCATQESICPTFVIGAK
jgi:phosphoribosyl 1,2-cyclic phosphodiesterase